MQITTMEWSIIAGGAAAIGLVNWYFLAGRSHPGAAVAGSSTAADAHVTIVVDGGYSPALVRVKAGAPVRLVFDRKDDSSCSEEIVIPDFGVRRFLPSGQKTTVEVTPPHAGRYEFMCGMSMLRGAIIAED